MIQRINKLENESAVEASLGVWRAGAWAGARSPEGGRRTLSERQRELSRAGKAVGGCLCQSIKLARRRRQWRNDIFIESQLSEVRYAMFEGASEKRIFLSNARASIRGGPPRRRCRELRFRAQKAFLFSCIRLIAMNYGGSDKLFIRFPLEDLKNAPFVKPYLVEIALSPSPSLGGQFYFYLHHLSQPHFSKPNTSLSQSFEDLGVGIATTYDSHLLFSFSSRSFRLALEILIPSFVFSKYQYQQSITPISPFFSFFFLYSSVII